MDTDGLDRALNEATVAGLRPRPDGSVALLLDVLALPENGPADPDTRRALVLSGVSRVRVLLRRELDGPPIPLADFDAVAAFFASAALHNSMYGWKFLDAPELIDDWPEVVSLDVRPGVGPSAHSLYWFNECGIAVEPGGYQPYCIEGTVDFETVAVERSDGTPMSVEDFTAAGKRWWDGFYSGDPRAK